MWYCIKADSIIYVQQKCDTLLMEGICIIMVTNSTDGTQA